MDPLGRPGSETGWGRRQGLTNPDRRRDFWTVNNHFLRTQKWKEDDKRFFFCARNWRNCLLFFFFQSISCVGLLQLHLCNSWWIYFQCETTIDVLKIKQQWQCAFFALGSSCVLHADGSSSEWKQCVLGSSPFSFLFSRRSEPAVLGLAAVFPS